MPSEVKIKLSIDKKILELVNEIFAIVLSTHSQATDIQKCPCCFSIYSRLYNRIDKYAQKIVYAQIVKPVKKK